MLAIRKGGKLPPPVYAEQYDLGVRQGHLEIPDAIDLGGRDIVIVNDVLATGGTLAAAARLLDRTGANVTAAVVARPSRRVVGRPVAPLPVHSLSRA